jgi:hypothetical protein
VGDDVGLELAEGAIDFVAVGDRPLDLGEALALGEVAGAAGRVVVDREHLVALVEQAVGEMGTDEAAPARDQDLHSRSLRPFCGDRCR